MDALSMVYPDPVITGHWRPAGTENYRPSTGQIQQTRVLNTADHGMGADQGGGGCR